MASSVDIMNFFVLDGDLYQYHRTEKKTTKQ